MAYSVTSHTASSFVRGLLLVSAVLCLVIWANLPADVPLLGRPPPASPTHLTVVGGSKTTPQTPLESWERNISWSSPAQDELAKETLSYIFDIDASLGRSVNGSLLSPLPGYRTPCWWEKIPDDYGEGPNIITGSVPKQLFLDADIKSLAQKLRERKRDAHMRCLPAFYIAGVYKCGSTDLFEALTRHEQILPPILKEPLLLLWMGKQYERRLFEDYLLVYDLVAEDAFKVKDQCQRRGGSNCDSYLAVDGTVTLLHSHNRWRHLPWNRGEHAPRLNIAHHLKVINPNAKFVFLLREPAQWLESCYNYYWQIYTNLTSEFIHNETVTLISSFRACLARHSHLMRCMYTYNQGTCNVINGLYYVYLRQWTEVFGSEQIFVAKSEDYFRDRHRTVGRILEFLGLNPMEPVGRFILDKTKAKNKRRHGVKMNPNTTDVIREFIHPWNVRLARLLGDERFLWERRLAFS